MAFRTRSFLAASASEFLRLYECSFEYAFASFTTRSAWFETSLPALSRSCQKRSGGVKKKKKTTEHMKKK
jgi:hypothetical protein